MSELLNQLHDEALDFRVRFTDTDGVDGVYEFLDLVFLGTQEYAVVSPVDSDGDVEIFCVLPRTGGEDYRRVTDETLLLQVFEVFRIQHEDEFDFD